MKYTVTVKPNAKENRVERVNETELMVWIKAPAREGKANDAVIRVVATYLGIAPSTIIILHGVKGKRKIFSIGV